jgi:hypothetical protein
MADTKDQKSLEMRVAELEDKVSKMHISEEELKAYHKVSALMGAQVGIPQLCTDPPHHCIVVSAGCIIFQPPKECNRLGFSAPLGGGFGTLGS